MQLNATQATEQVQRDAEVITDRLNTIMPCKLVKVEIISIDLPEPIKLNNKYVRTTWRAIGLMRKMIQQ
jgi:exopolysaccharide biosynthesis predicted pyruvyltransferase EpsI